MESAWSRGRAHEAGHGSALLSWRWCCGREETGRGRGGRHYVFPAFFPIITCRRSDFLAFRSIAVPSTNRYSVPMLADDD